jgi:LPXTG-motif cell wall-anchored protein
MKRMMKPWSCIVIGLVLWLTTLGQGIAAPDGENTPPAGPPAVPGQAAPDTPAPMTDIHDIHPPVPVGFDAPWLMPVLLTLAGVVILAALVWWWRRRRKQKKIETIVPELPPDMIANKALEEIGDVRGQDGKAFYFRLSAILRQYIWGRFGVGAPEMTTEEFLPCIARLPVDRELARQLKQLCRAMDPVKFGGVTAMEKQMESDLFFVRGFVRQTTPAVEGD